MNNQPPTPETKKAWKVWGKDDDYYAKCNAEIYYAPTRNEAKMQWASKNMEPYVNAVIRREPSEDLRLFEGTFKSELSIRQIEFERERLKKILSLEDESLYCIQDKRKYVGNAIIWWASGGNGYTTDIDKAWTLKGSEVKQRNWRPSDIIWPYEEVLIGIVRNVDMQYLDRSKSI